MNEYGTPFTPESEHTLYPGLSKRTKELMGLREFTPMSENEVRDLLGSEQRFQSYQNMRAETIGGAHQREFKKGITREIVENKMLNEQLLKEQPTVYIGSGTDLEYPLVLG